MSKKLAEGSSALVLDVKCGAGAFMKSEPEADALARALVDIGIRAGLRTEAVLTSMDAPLGRAVGNAVEIAECVDTLKGNGPADLTEVLLTLAARMLVVSGVYDEHSAPPAIRAALASGAALQTLRRMIDRQGGDATVIDDPTRLPGARQRACVTADRSGFVTAVHAERVGRASMVLGAGRERVGDRIDHGAGVLVSRRRADQVSAGEVLLELLYNDDRRLEEALVLARDAVTIGDGPPLVTPRVIGAVR
jgi:thymidine phosphorylase